MKKPTLDACWAKLRRAEEQIYFLDKQLRSYMERDAYEIVSEPAPRADGKRWCKYSSVQDPPLRLSVVLGELIHDLRSSLDHLVWQLVRLNGRRPSGRNGFPICETLRKGQKSENGSFWLSHSPKLIEGVNESHVALIQDLQPYHAGRYAYRHPLNVLHSLWNVDKHRVVHAAVMSLERPPVHLEFRTGGYPGIKAKLTTIAGRVANGADAYNLEILEAPVGLPREMHVHVQQPSRVLFGDRKIGLTDLYMIGKFIYERVFGSLASDFGPIPSNIFKKPPPELLGIPRGGVAVTIGEPGDDAPGFEGWRIWFELLRLDMPPGGEPESIPPSWYMKSPGGLATPIPAVGLTEEVLRSSLGRFLSPRAVEAVFAHFRPIPRRSDEGIWALTPGDHP
jgi:hypothetical protein